MGAAAGLAVAGVVVAVAISVYVADRSELRGQIDRSLADVARPYETQRQHPASRGPEHDGRPGGGPGPRDGAPPAAFGGASGYVQFVYADGTVARLHQGEIDTIPAKKSLVLGDIQRAFPFARRAGRYENFG